MEGDFEATMAAEDWRRDTLTRLPDEVVARTTVALAAGLYRELGHPSTDEARIEAHYHLAAALEEFRSRQLERGWDPPAEAVIERASVLVEDMTAPDAGVDSFVHLGGALALLDARDSVPRLSPWAAPAAGPAPGPGVEL